MDNYKQQLETAIGAEKYLDVWQVDMFPLVNRIQVVATIKAQKFKVAAHKMSLILRTIQRIGTNGHDVRLGIKIPNGATIITAIFDEAIVQKTDWSQSNIDWRKVTSELNVASQLRGKPN